MTAKRARARKGIAVFLIAALVWAWLPHACAQVEITLPESHPAYRGMAQLAADNLVPGYVAGDFERSRELTREDFARAIIAAQEFYNLNPDKFSNENIEVLTSLKEEFRDEIDQLGGVYAPQADEVPVQPVMVPTTHWAYAALGDFAKRGLFPGLSGENFSGGRVYSRTELAALSARIIEMSKSYPDVFSDSDRETVSYLEQEFREEIATAAAPLNDKSTNVPAAISSRGEKPLFKGSSNLFLGVTKSNKTSFANRVSLETNGGRLQGYLTGDMDNAERTGAAVDFGQGYTFEVTRRLLGWHTRPGDPEKDSYVTAGNVTGIDFGSGLTVGAASLRGAYASLRAGGGRVILLGGDDSSGRPVTAARYTQKTAGSADWAVTLYKQSQSTGSVQAMGMDYSASAPSRRLSMEYTLVQGAGRGMFARLQRDVSKTLRTRLEVRNYRDFILDNNNQPQYLGRSGGDEENERSIYAYLEWRPRPQWTFTASRDHLYSPEVGRRTGLYVGSEWQPSGKWLLGGGFESERGGATAERERSVKMRYAGMRNLIVTGSWKRNVGGSGPASTTRMDFTLPVISDAAKMIISATRRRTRSRRANSYRLRISGPTGGAQASLSFDYAPTGSNRFDVSMTWTF